MLFTLGISEDMNRMKDVQWSEKMKVYFEQVMRAISPSVGNLGSGEILRDIEENTRNRGALEVSVEDLQKAVLDNIPIFYRHDLKKLLHNLGIDKGESDAKRKEDAVGKICRDIMRASDIAGVSADKELIKKILKVYQNALLSPRVKISFGTTTKKAEHRELEVRYMSNDNVHNPFAIAVENQLFQTGGHPVEKLFEELSSSFPVMGYGVDFSASSGIKYMVTVFAPHLPQQVEKVFGLVNVPESILKSKEFLSKYRALYISAVMTNFLQKTVSLRFDTKQIGMVTSKLIMEMLTDLKFEIPKIELMELCRGARTMVITYNWQVSRIQKIAFEVEPRKEAEIPKNLNAKIETFIQKVPFYSQEKKYVYAISFTKKGQYMKIENFYSEERIE